jgi:glycosyltransferase involved in cell wall biosynthesis
MVKEKDRYQVISIHLPFAEVLPATIIGKLLGKKVYLTHNGDLILPKGLFNRLLEKTYYWLTYWSAKASDGIIAQTEDYARSSSLLSRLGKKLIFIKAPVEIPAPDKAIIEEIKRENHLEGKKLVGFAGRFVEEKGFDYLLKAIPDVLEKISGNNFCLCGENRY